MVVTTAVLATLLKDPLTKAFGWTIGEALKGTRNQNIENSLKTLSTRITEVVKVKTFYQIDDHIDLHDFYIPTNLDFILGDIGFIRDISKRSIVLEGTVGQGKSIFMRYLTYQEAQQGQRLPVFFELRRLENDQNLEEAICSTISSWIPLFTKEHFNKVAGSGNLVLFLDGFDEVPYEKVQNLINELERWGERYPEMQLVISARPESEIQKSHDFKVHRLSSYTFTEQEKLIDKLVKDGEIQEVLKKAIQSSSTEIQQLLQTPLMVTLFVMQYKKTLMIPNNQSEFYENLFYSLVSRHDNTKAGFKRYLNSGLSILKLQEIFEEFCFITKNNEKLVLSQIETIKVINYCLISQDIKSNSYNILKDLSTVVCLILKDGLDYSFIHRSIQEYFYASFISNKSSKAKEAFYKECSINESFLNRSLNVLSFLKKIDTYNYNRFFEIPLINKFIKCYQITYNNNKIIESLYVLSSHKAGEKAQIMLHLKEELVIVTGELVPSELDSLLRNIVLLAKDEAISGIAYGWGDFESSIRAIKLKDSFEEVLLTTAYKKSIDAGNSMLEYQKGLEHYVSKKDGLDLDYGKFK